MSKKAVIYATDERGVYVGRLERHFKRTNVQPTLLVSLEDELELIDSVRRDRVKGKSFLIPSGMNVELNTHGSHVALFFLDNLGEDLARLKPLMSSVLHLGEQHCFGGMGGEAEVVEFANILRNQRPSLNTAQRMIDDWLAHASPVVPDTDPRVARAIKLIKENYDQNISAEWLAQHVGLSAPRLAQLFKQVTGSPIRRFRLWHRIFVTAAKLSEGIALTDAAVAAGFSDYAQFSRTYRELAGASPSDARDNTDIRLSGYL